MESHEIEHEWFQRKLPVAAAGFLRPEDDDRLRSHLEDCEECAARWAQFAPIDAEDIHLSSQMIARWPQASEKLVGYERELVVHHLARCEACREDLEMAGFSPALDESSEQVVIPLGRTTPGKRSPRRSWWQGATVGAAAGLVAAAMAWLAWTPREDPSVQGALPLVVSGQLRGGLVEIPAGSRALALTVAVPLDFDLESPATIQVRDPDDRLLLDSGVDAAALSRGTVVFVVRSRRPLDSGVYSVTLRQSGAEERSTFELQMGRPQRRP